MSTIPPNHPQEVQALLERDVMALNMPCETDEEKLARDRFVAFMRSMRVVPAAGDAMPVSNLGIPEEDE